MFAGQVLYDSAPGLNGFAGGDATGAPPAIATMDVYGNASVKARKQASGRGKGGKPKKKGGITKGSAKESMKIHDHSQVITVDASKVRGRVNPGYNIFTCLLCASLPVPFKKLLRVI